MTDHIEPGLTPLSKPAERRFSRRARTYKMSQLILHEHGGVFDAILKNLSRTGAQLELSDVHHIPDEFQVRFVTDNIIRSCQVVWRRANSMGVVFPNAK